MQQKTKENSNSHASSGIYLPLLDGGKNNN